MAAHKLIWSPCPWPWRATPQWLDPCSAGCPGYRSLRFTRLFAAIKTHPSPGFRAGLPDGLFPNQTPSFGTFWKAFERIILISFMTIWYTYFVAICFTLCPFGILCCGHLIYYSHFGKLYQEKSGDTGSEPLNALQISNCHTVTATLLLRLHLKFLLRSTYVANFFFFWILWTFLIQDAKLRSWVTTPAL
jgi:hypothetical protein